MAGIAAGLGVLTNGVTFRGSYLQLSNFGQFEVGPGVAPEASLYALKVFGFNINAGGVHLIGTSPMYAHAVHK